MGHIQLARRLLLKWFKAQGNKIHTRHKIRLLCQELNSQFNLGIPDKSSFYVLFEPLLRIGLMDYYGNGKYFLTSSVLLLYPNTIIGINITDELKAKLVDEQIAFNKASFGIIRLSISNLKQIQNISIDFNVPLEHPSDVYLFTQLPDLGHTIKLWKKEKLFETTNFQYYTNGSWKSNEGNMGIYRSAEEAYAKRLFFDGQGNWYLIPRADNPDAFNIAASYSSVVNNWDLGICYHKEKQRLEIENIYFPILLDRLLFKYTIPQEQDMLRDRYKTTYFNIPNNVFHQINRIYHQKIKVK